MNETSSPSAKAIRIPPDTRHLITDLIAEYGLLIDENRLEEWVELFCVDCDYKIVSRENVEQDLPNVMIWCDNKNMLRDRVESYRHVNEYNLHWDRHVIGPLRFCGHADGVWSIEASYSLAQTTLEGATTLFSVGRYLCEVLVESEHAKFKSVKVIADTGLIPTLLATPI
jgi:anthranilate 1,2-dioxygenase small subunit